MSDYGYDINRATLNATRSQFKMHYNLKTTFNAGDLIPLGPPIEVYPGDRFKCPVSAIARELTLLNPVMDNMYLEIHAFFVPNRLVYNKWKQFNGEAENEAWTNTNDYEIPSARMNIDPSYDTNNIGLFSIGDYYGLPVNVQEEQGEEKVSYLPLRGYCEIYNYWYLNEATQAPILYSKENNIEFDIHFKAGYGSSPLKVNRFGDKYTTCLPSPQKGPNVNFLSDLLPVVSRNNDSVALTGGVTPIDFLDNTAMEFKGYGGEVMPDGYIVLNDGQVGVSEEPQIGADGLGTPSNLYAITQGSLRSINDFRISAAAQHYYEKLANFGSRYEETIYALFGVRAPSAVLQVPQYLGGVKKLINVDQVLSTAENAQAVLGTTGAYSLTAIQNEHLFTFASWEHGLIHILAHIRTDNTYCQGIPKIFSKKTKFDFYNPCFANIGNVAVKNKEIFFADVPEKDDAVFGYQEAWYELRHLDNILTGYMRPNIDGGFGQWTYGRVFEETPVLNEAFVLQDDKEVKRTVAIQSDKKDQFKLDVFFDITASRVMPVYSIPGLTRI